MGGGKDHARTVLPPPERRETMPIPSVPSGENALVMTSPHGAYWRNWEWNLIITEPGNWKQFAALIIYIYSCLDRSHGSTGHVRERRGEVWEITAGPAQEARRRAHPSAGLSLLAHPRTKPNTNKQTKGLFPARHAQFNFHRFSGTAGRGGRASDRASRAGHPDARPSASLHYITCHLADAFIQSYLQLIRLSRRHTPWSNVGLRGLAQWPNSCADLIVATPGIEPLTLRVQVK